MERSREVDSTITDVAQECLRDSESIRKKTMNEYDSLVGKAFKGFAGEVLDAASAMEPGGAVHRGSGARVASHLHCTRIEQLPIASRMNFTLVSRRIQNKHGQLKV